MDFHYIAYCYDASFCCYIYQGLLFNSAFRCSLEIWVKISGGVHDVHEKHPQKSRVSTDIFNGVTIDLLSIS
jgi:hypothetical protein